MIPSGALFPRRLRSPAAFVLFSLTPLGPGCAQSTPPPCEPSAAASTTSGAAEGPSRDPASEEKQIAAVLDDWHDAAAKADEARYFGHLAEQSVFMGTDATERWDKAAFRAYASPHFAKGKAWRFRAARRTIVIGVAGDVAWFDEDLETEKLGPARGSGVLVRAAQAWKIAHYNLSIPIPNERFDAVRTILAVPPPAAPGAK